jgi:hypothetical protein
VTIDSRRPKYEHRAHVGQLVGLSAQQENIEALLRDQGLAFTHPAEDTGT